MGKISLSWMLLGVTLIAMLFGVARISVQTGCFAGLTVFPFFVAVFLRREWSFNHAAAITIQMLVAGILGSVLVGWGSYYYSFIEPSQGFLIGDGWRSVFSGAVFGVLYGLICGVFSLVLYIVYAMFEKTISVHR